MKPWLKYTIAATFFVVGVGGSIAYNQFLAPTLSSKWVYVAPSSLTANQPVPTNYVRERIPDDQISPGAITNPALLKGMYTSQAMSAKEQFTSLNLESNPFTITSGTKDVPIASDWIAAVSETIRSGDRVELIPLVPQQQSRQKATNLAVVPPSNAQANLDNLLVLSVHTTSNQEVVNQPPSTGPQTIGARTNGSGTPSELDLKMTTAQAQTFAQDVQNGDKFFIWGVPHTHTKSQGGTQP